MSRNRAAMVSAFRLFLRPATTTTHRSLALRLAPGTTFALVSATYKVPTHIHSSGKLSGEVALRGSSCLPRYRIYKNTRTCFSNVNKRMLTTRGSIIVLRNEPFNDVLRSYLGQFLKLLSLYKYQPMTNWMSYL